MKKYKVTYTINNKDGKKKIEKIIEAQHLEHARNIFKKSIQSIPLNYRIKEIK